MVYKKKKPYVVYKTSTSDFFGKQLSKPMTSEPIITSHNKIKTCGRIIYQPQITQSIICIISYIL